MLNTKVRKRVSRQKIAYQWKKSPCIWFAFTKNHNLWLNRLYYHQFTTSKGKMSQKSILARIFGLRQGFKDKSCPVQEIRETRTRYHSWSHLGNCHQRFEETSPSFLGQSKTLCKILMDLRYFLNYFLSVTSNVGYLADGCFKSYQHQESATYVIHHPKSSWSKAGH